MKLVAADPSGSQKRLFSPTLRAPPSLGLAVDPIHGSSPCIHISARAFRLA